MKILNLYACLGGNRYKWTDCEVTAVEIDPELCDLYQERFPDDKVICGDAHEFLLNNYKDYDFIWSSPPCPTHSRARQWGTFRKTEKKIEPVYPDMALYQEIIFLDNYFEGKYCVENVIPYYEPLITGNKRGRHIYWTNFRLPNDLGERKMERMDYTTLKQWCEFHDYDFTKYKGSQRLDKICRNLVDYEAGKTILDTARGILKNKTNQLCLF